MFELFCICIW